MNRHFGKSDFSVFFARYVNLNTEVYFPRADFRSFLRYLFSRCSPSLSLREVRYLLIQPGGEGGEEGTSI